MFVQSVLENTDEPVQIVPLTEAIGKKLGVGTDGTNSFTKLRFLVPYLCGFKGHAMWADGADMLCLADISELWGERDNWHGVKVVKHDYQSTTSMKYIGTEMEAANYAYPKKNWSSLMLFTNSYAPHEKLTPEFVNKQPGSYLHRFSWMPEERIGDLPAEWNHIPLELPYDINAKLVHFSLGIPGFEHYGDCDYATHWKQTMLSAQEGMQYQITVKRG